MKVKACSPARHKAAALAVIAAVALAAASCGDDDSASTAESVRESGTVRIGVRNDNPPLSFLY
ncbi:MAG: hypothetical protein ACR2O6_15795, partial [Ilumatobacteraceae bacterium]